MTTMWERGNIAGEQNRLYMKNTILGGEGAGGMLPPKKSNFKGFMELFSVETGVHPCLIL